MSINSQAPNNINITSHGTRETGFPEPLSTERNTTLPHGDAQTAPHEELDTNVISAKSHHRRPHIPGHHHKHEKQQRAERAQEEMYSGLEVHDNVDDGKQNDGEQGYGGQKDGVVKKVLNKLSCGTV